MISATLFVLAAAVLCALCLLGMVGAAQAYLASAQAIANDGLARGTRAPRWSLADSSGAVHRSPSAGQRQLVMFTDHSLKSFPSVAEGLRAAAGGDLQIVVLLREPNELAAPVLRALGLGRVPVLTGSAALYGRYNVRVTPFAIIVDAAGRVRASSLVNYSWQIAKLAQLAELPLEPAAPRAPGRLRARLARTGG